MQYGMLYVWTQIGGMWQLYCQCWESCRLRLSHWLGMTQGQTIGSQWNHQCCLHLILLQAILPRLNFGFADLVHLAAQVCGQLRDSHANRMQVLDARCQMKARLRS